MSSPVTNELALLCACTGTAMLSVLAAAVASYEGRTGRSRDPLRHDPRHRRHRRQQRQRSRSRPAVGDGGTDNFGAVLDVVREVRQVIESSPTDPGGHDTAARAILPAALRLRGLSRRCDLDGDQRRAVRRFRRLLVRYAAEDAGWQYGDRDAIRAEVERAARLVERTFNSDAATAGRPTLA